MHAAVRRAWHDLTPVERTAVGTCLFRCRMTSSLKQINPYWIDEFDKALFEALMPPKAVKEWQNTSANQFMSVRTAELDQQAIQVSRGTDIRQVVILGAGLDTRAWRLPWPAGKWPPQVLLPEEGEAPMPLLSCPTRRHEGVGGGHGVGRANEIPCAGAQALGQRRVQVVCGFRPGAGRKGRERRD